MTTTGKLHLVGEQTTESGAQPGWDQVSSDLNAHGCAILQKLLTPQECERLAALYAGEEGFRSRIVMSRHGFGRGEYKYFSYPLPAPIASLRTSLYPPLAAIANDWNARMKIDARFPATHAEFLARCHNAGQSRPTPLPLQYAVLLSEPGRDFTGGEFVITEQRPRMQSRAEVVPLRQGDGVIFAVHHRPVSGTKGDYRVNLRHGVSRLRSGRRHTVGIIFHDAK